MLYQLAIPNSTIIHIANGHTIVDLQVDHIIIKPT